jgi:hypothetical protein
MMKQAGIILFKINLKKLKINQLITGYKIIIKWKSWMEKKETHHNRTLMRIFKFIIISEMISLKNWLLFKISIKCYIIIYRISISEIYQIKKN